MIGVGEHFPAYIQLDGIVRDNNFVTVDFDSDGWKVIYFYPKDFTFICPTEIVQFDMITPEAEVIGISGDNEFCKLNWKQSDPRLGDIHHTLAADCGLSLSHALGIVADEGVCLRATYIVDEGGMIQHVSVNALDTGRNAYEIERTLKALQAGGLTGCGWQEGDGFVA